MNVQDCDVLRTLSKESFINQRILAETSGHSLGVVNRSLKKLLAEGYVDKKIDLTNKAQQLIRNCAPQNAIILAAGFGMRMVPINLSTPKALIEVNGECLINRLITQLHAVGITDITVVVGFMKESFEYLIDEYGVDLVVNEEYATKNNLHSLALVADRIQNTYIVPCDVWCKNNPFSETELYSWYMVSDSMEKESCVRINRRSELIPVHKNEVGNTMIGISYLMRPESVIIGEKLKLMDDESHAECFWEEILYKKDPVIVQANVINSADVHEINTYEQLRDIDSGSNQLQSEAIHTITNVLKCRNSDIVNICVLKKGMTNRSFLFTANGAKYIMRIPGEGTDQLINRKQEADVYRIISGHNLCDDPIYINPSNGYKITKFLEGVRVCDTESEEDLSRCMKKLHQLHAMDLKVDYSFDIFEQIEFYESLWNNKPSIYKDYYKTKKNVMSLRPYIDKIEKQWCLTHIDAVPDNFLFYTPEGETEEQLQLTDWEYSSMQDPHVDIAMFCIYSLYDKNHCDRLIDIYFGGICDQATRAKIYAYISMCGLLWSNWCEYKRSLGVEFGEYSLRQYRYAKDYYNYARELLDY